MKLKYKPESARRGRFKRGLFATVGVASARSLCLMVLPGRTGAERPAPQAKKPNVLIIWGDDIGQFNISAYNLGIMGYKTPNIDRIAKEDALFTDWSSLHPAYPKVDTANQKELDAAKHTLMIANDQ